jgi:amino acid adenylation domain-containing protein
LLERVHETISKRAADNPDSLAIICSRLKITYGELDNCIRKTANRLLSAIGPVAELPVAVLTSRSEWAIIAMFATWRANAVYMPLAEDLPRERLRSILERIHPAAMLVDSRHAGRLREAWDECPLLEIGASAGPGESGEPAPEPSVAPQDVMGDQLACLVHTSGSSGPAKATMITHRALRNVVETIAVPYAPGPADRALHFGAFGWDSSIEEAILPLYRGATLVIRSDEADYGVPRFLTALRDLAVTHIYLPTSYWHEICLEMSRGPIAFPASLRCVLIGGEQPSGQDLAVWRRLVPATVDLWNCYGLTETCVTSTLYLDDRSIPVDRVSGLPLGRACDSVTVDVLDDRMQPVAPRQTGEMYVGGPGVARGYWGDPAATAASFVPDPRGLGRLYKTGDMAWADESGLLHFGGRADRQIKISGFRIGLNEVEDAFAGHPCVRRVCVVPRTGTTGHTEMIAYLELAAPTRVQDIRDYLARYLEPFRMPAVIEILPALPQLASGKINVSELIALAASPSSRANRDGVNGDGVNGDGADGAGADDAGAQDALPDGEIERIWCEALGIASCGRTDDFFDLGGNSLSGMRIVGRINEICDLDIQFRDVLESRTIAALADRMASLARGE